MGVDKRAERNGSLQSRFTDKGGPCHPGCLKFKLLPLGFPGFLNLIQATQAAFCERRLIQVSVLNINRLSSDNKRKLSKMSENYVAPNQQRYLRACMVCSIVMTQARFREEGCPNCEEFLHLQGAQDQIESCTSQVFEGIITLANPKKSWVAKWQRLDGYVRGVYATKVSGQLPDEVRAVMEEEYRIQYIPSVVLWISVVAPFG
jgi:transcription elongation factor SPT4